MVGESNSITRLRAILKEFENRLPSFTDIIWAQNVDYYAECCKVLEAFLSDYHEIMDSNINDQAKKLCQNIVRRYRIKLMDIVNSFDDKTDFMILEYYRRLISVFKENEVSFDDDNVFEKCYKDLSTLRLKGIVGELTESEIQLTKSDPNKIDDIVERPLGRIYHDSMY